MASSHEHGEHGAFDGMAVEHVLGSLSEEDARLFRAHLLQCPHCRARVGELRTIAHDLAGVEQAAAREAASVEAPAVAPEQPGGQVGGEPPRPRRRWGRLAPSRQQAWMVVVLAVAVGLAIALAAWGIALRGQVSDLERDVRVEERAAQVSALGQPWDIDEAAEGVDAAISEDGEVLVLVAQGLPEGTDRLRLLDEGGTPTHDMGVVPEDGSLVRVIASVTCDVEQLELLHADATVLGASRVCEE